MKVWQQLLAIGGILLLCFLVILYQKFMTATKMITEAFQTATDALPPETSLERQAYDIFEFEQGATDAPPTTFTEKYDSAATLGEFDDDAPVPWDFDNKDADPKDILWGAVDTRGSQELYERAKMRFVFSTANNVEVQPDMSMGYYSTKLNGMIIHDPAAIIAVKYLEFAMDTAIEEVIESGIERMRRGLIGKEGRIIEKASEQAKADLKAENKARKARGQPRLKWNSKEYNDFYKLRQAENIKQLKVAEEAKGGLRSGRLSRALKPVGTAAKEFRSLLGKSIRTALKPAAPAFRRLTKSVLSKLGQRAARGILAKFAARRAAVFLAVKTARDSAVRSLNAIPIYGQIINIAYELMNLMFLVVIPQILADYADLEENPAGSNCIEGKFQGCPQSHPFNLQCAVEKAIGPLFWEIFIAIPLLGDSIGAFAPYLCSANNLTAVFRQSFRPPPYYFDSTLSIFFAEKPPILSGTPEGTEADPMYYDPGLFRLKPDDVKPNTSFWSDANLSTAWNSPFHPWVDFSHEEMLDKMAQFYYEKAIQFAEVDADGVGEFQYITQFKGLIASSQYSCDVQVVLTKITFKPFTGETISETAVPNPYETMESADTGCSFHDRRFYFTWDFTKSGFNLPYDTLTPAQITDRVNSILAGQSSADRMATYRKMCVVIGCTHENGTAADVVDNTPDGEPIADAPVGLGSFGQGYLPPIVAAPSQFLGIPTDDSCRTVPSKINHYGTRYVRPAREEPLDKPPTNERRIYLSKEADYISGLLETTPIRRRFVSQILPYVPTKSQLSQVDSPLQGDVIDVRDENRGYIFWRGAWVPYSPKPVWQNKTDLPNGTLTWLQGTTKLWAEKRMDRSDKQRWLSGIQGGLTAYLPLRFGIQGGAIATTMDAFGISSAIACLYQDVFNQQGNFVLNGITITSQPKFVVNRGPIILYAPGYTPRLTRMTEGFNGEIRNTVCKSFQVNQKVCSNRSAIRAMIKRYEASFSTERREVQFLLSSVPDPEPSRCLYTVNSVAVATDGTDTAGTERTDTVAISYSIPANSKTCTFVPGALERLTGPVDVSPISLGTKDFNPPLTKAAFDAIPPATDAVINARSKPFRRATTCSTHASCASAAVQAELRQQFNDKFIFGEDSTGKKYGVELVSIDANRTPTAAELGAKVGSQDTTCSFKTTVRVDTNGVKATSEHYITMVLGPRPGSTCAYDLVSHDFPLKYFPAPVPKSGIFEVPRSKFIQQGRLTRGGCPDTDCSGFAVMDSLVSQFNLRYTDRKILRIIKASTPLVPTRTCDYEVDIQRMASGKSFVERDTLRITLGEGPNCGWTRVSDGSDKRQTGATIDTATDSQRLINEYVWPTNYISAVRKKLNEMIATFIPLDVPGSVDAAARSMKEKLTVVASQVKATTIQGCRAGSKGSLCKDESVLRAFMNRYAFDAAPPYPSGQFGSTVRTIVGWRRAGLAGPRECHLELIEREEYFPNWIVMRKDSPDNRSAETAKVFLRQYAFGIDEATMRGDTCAITPRRFSSVELSTRSFDISGDPFGLKAPDTQVVLPASFSYRAPQIDATSLLVLNAMKAAADQYKPKKAGYIRQEVAEVRAVLMARPNVIEYRVKLNEFIQDPDFGIVRSTGIDGIVVVKWTEDQWNPVSGEWIGSPTPTGANILVFVPGRVDFTNKMVRFDGDVYENPPYLFWPVPPISGSQELRIREITLIAPDRTSTGWRFKATENSAATTWTG